ncbi:hypothetical protein KC19_3G102800 [Ceratodon purpureus]|uniref:GDSL esterase/lipase n=2 Tax=Ceratodon purpureus TaxID=3225 RepID=A0A8T0IJD5_CERPU|nr:hypothetical protein KC19_3G102800 [Ceratodon purpureus]
MSPASRARALDPFAFINYGTVVTLVVVMVLGLSNMGIVHGAEAIYIFGDSYLDTGNIPATVVPYGSNWPGYPAGRWSDGRGLTDYFAELFGLPTPTPYLHLKNDSSPLQGINFARTAAGITYAFGVTELDSQVDDMEALVHNDVLTNDHLKKSVTVLNIGVNDYDVRNFQAPFQESAFRVQELKTYVHTVVNGIAVNIVRLHSFGIRNIVVLNLPLLVCMPLSTLEVALDFKACSSNNTFINETSLHNSLLQQRVRMLNQNLKGLNVIIADQAKAFGQLFYHGSDYGFVNPLTPCCHGSNNYNLYSYVCGQVDAEGKPIYTVCKDPNKAVLFDVIHPTQAASKTMVDLYASVSGYTSEGPKLKDWIRKYNV